MSDTDAMRNKMLKSIEEKTGLKPDNIVEKIKQQPLKKHMEKVKFVKTTFNLSHGFANLLVHMAKGDSLATEKDEKSLLKHQFEGKEEPKKWYDSIAEQVREWKGVELAPKKAYVSLRTKKQFAILQPSTKKRLDVGLNLKGMNVGDSVEAAGSFNSMVTHRFRVESDEDINPDLYELLNMAYKNSLT